jgi:hypothetical protein
MRAICPKCKKMVTVYTQLKKAEARQLLSDGEPIQVMHVCPVAGGDVEWLVSKYDGESLER